MYFVTEGIRAELNLMTTHTCKQQLLPWGCQAKDTQAFFFTTFGSIFYQLSVIFILQINSVDFLN